MNTGRDFYGWLGLVAMVATPLAAALLFGWELYDYLISEALMPLGLAVAGGVAGAVAIESVGIYAGHVGMDYARRRDWRGLVAGAALLFYVGLGWWKVPEYGEVFVLAAFMYVLVALRHEAVGVDGLQQAQAADETAWKRELQAERLRLKHEERLAEIAANAAHEAHGAQDAAHGAQSATQSGGDATLYECACGKVYESPQGYSAHTRWCAVYKATLTPALSQGEREQPSPQPSPNGRGGYASDVGGE